MNFYYYLYYFFYRFDQNDSLPYFVFLESHFLMRCLVWHQKNTCRNITLEYQNIKLDIATFGEKFENFFKQLLF